jgi:hypothetical protein
MLLSLDGSDVEACGSHIISSSESESGSEDSLSEEQADSMSYDEVDIGDVGS